MVVKCCWVLWEVFEGCWRLLKVVRGFCMLLKVVGGCWMLMKVVEVGENCLGSLGMVTGKSCWRYRGY